MTQHNKTKSHATCVMKRLQGPKIPPCWWKTILQETTTSLTGRLEEFDVAAQPRLQTGKQRDGQWTGRETGMDQPYHKGADNNIGHLGQLIVQQGCGGMVCYLATTQPINNILTQAT